LDTGVHTTRLAKKFEWFGLTVVKRYLELNATVQDVHADPRYFSKGVDLVVQGTREFSIDLKIDSYIGTDPNRKIRGQCNPNSGVILLETISQLQYNRNRTDVSGWFYTSEADEIYYYYLALLNEPGQLNEIYNEYKDCVKSGRETETAEDRLIKSIEVDNDLLVTYALKEARVWLKANLGKLDVSYSGATNPTYVTVSLRVPRAIFLEPNGPARSLGRIYPKVRSSF
jgi:hypothetical protein